MAGSARGGASLPTSAASFLPSTTPLSPDTVGASVGSIPGLPRDISETRVRGLEDRSGVLPQTLNARGGRLISAREPCVPSCASVNYPQREGSTSGFSMAAFGRHDPLSSTSGHMQSGPLSSSSGGVHPPRNRTGDPDCAASRPKAVDKSSSFEIPDLNKEREDNVHVRSHGTGRARGAPTPSPYHVALPESSSSCRQGRGGSFDSRSTTASPDFPPTSTGTQPPRQGRPSDVKSYNAAECAVLPSAHQSFAVPVASVSGLTESSIADLSDRFSSSRNLCASVGSTVATVPPDQTRTVLTSSHKTSCRPSSSHDVFHSPKAETLSLPAPSPGTCPLNVLPNGKSPVEGGGAEQTARVEGMEEEDDDLLGDSFVVVEAVEGREEVPGCAFSPPPLRFPSHCFSADGLWDSEGPHGDFAVSVSDPETRSTGPLGRFTLYLVSGRTVAGAPFACRKRYSDFEWLRMQLVQAFPGVFVPPIPRKQKLGRFDSSFVESRRQGLQEFLQRLFRRRHLAKCSVFVGWLTRSPEGGMDQFKKEVAARPLVEQLGEFQEIFRAQLDGASGRGTRAESDRFIVFKQFLGKQLTTLEELHRHFSRLASLSRSQFGCVSALQTLLRDVCSAEENLVRQIPDLPIPAVRCELASLVSLQRACLVASPAHNYDVMQQVVAKEFDDTECMLEAVSGLERLVQLKHQAQAQIGREENSLRHVLRSTRGSWLQTFVHRKDKDAQIAEIRASIEALKLQVQILEQWAEASRAVWVTVEMPKLVTAKSIAFTRAAHAFIDRQQQQFLQEARIWQAYGLRTGASAEALSSQPTAQARSPSGPDSARKH
ncbi:putative PX domain-containing protein [Neospora caninum Liverpool]|uniref:PX domain-containing protein, putative n=1 Tax=Neospora caninum (strain Liverpool) TaxID=572307 RepID=F0VMM6_NEOCL|nr:putative PX domain-containing protein [Neospora caninum Liverpool]CBZ54972.1 putative PX domain-containing protein [Neospora caninum Liverpool]CEL69694.1 TPA: PX domain-containing protein, putative [Neospora caninum Liverpool]|eukprot:XP_003885000.1 putative PX domain-containing protein [Neospora caninum Liverpool]